jgi:hypothetical protein
VTQGVVPRIVTVGAVTPAGLDAESGAFIARAELLDPEPSEALDSRDRPIGVHRVGAIDPALDGVERLIALALPALARIEATSAPVPLFLALPEPGRPGVPEIDDGAFLERLAAVARIDLGASRVARSGSSGGVWAMEAAGHAARNGRAALAGGVDSFVAPQASAWLDAEERLGTGERDGTVPAEGAAFALVAPSAADDAVQLAAAGFFPADAARDLLAAHAGAWLLTDLDGTEVRAIALADLVIAAGGARFAQQDDLLWLYGEVGAAASILLAVHAATAFRAGWAPAQRALCLLGADAAGARGAVVLGGGHG